MRMHWVITLSIVACAACAQIDSASGSRLGGARCSENQQLALAFRVYENRVTSRMMVQIAQLSAALELADIHFRVVHWLRHAPDPSRRPNDWENSRESVALALKLATKHVDTITEHMFNASFLKAREVQGQIAQEGFGPKWTKGKAWDWMFSLSTHFLWYEQYQHVLPSCIQHVWYMEPDVAYTGDIVKALTTFPLDSDLVAVYPARILDYWASKRTCEVADDHMVKTLIFLNRTSRRLLSALIDRLKNGCVMHDEYVLGSACSLNSEWCKISFLFSSHHPLAGVDDAGETLLSAGGRVFIDQWRQIHASNQTAFYHPLKW